MTANAPLGACPNGCYLAGRCECAEREERRRIWREAPYGYAVCRVCFYEKPIGVPCGEPCV